MSPPPAPPGTPDSLEQRACSVYLRYDTTVNLIKTLAEELGLLSNDVDLHVRELGSSSEGRPLVLITMEPSGSSDPVREGGKGKDVVAELLMVGGMHAREWISSASVLCIVARHYARLADAVRNHNVRLQFLPNLNPDGYAYTRTTLRNWRKTRTTLPAEANTAGIDLNRNFGVDNVSWGFGKPRAFTSELYQGEYPFQAIEAQILRDLVLEGRPARRVVLDVHCCARVVFPVFNATETRVAEANQLAQASRGVLKFRPRSDVVDFRNTGIAIDWMEQYAGVRAAFMLEVPGRLNADVFADIFRVPGGSIRPTTDMIMNVLNEAIVMYSKEDSMSVIANRNMPPLHPPDLAIASKKMDDFYKAKGFDEEMVKDEEDHEGEKPKDTLFGYPDDIVVSLVDEVPQILASADVSQEEESDEELAQKAAAAAAAVAEAEKRAQQKLLLEQQKLQEQQQQGQQSVAQSPQQKKRGFKKGAVAEREDEEQDLIVIKGLGVVLDDDNSESQTHSQKDLEKIGVAGESHSHHDTLAVSRDRHSNAYPASRTGSVTLELTIEPTANGEMSKTSKLRYHSNVVGEHLRSLPSPNLSRISSLPAWIPMLALLFVFVSTILFRRRKAVKDLTRSKRSV
mmetsp:Transcript_22769/g.44728  ORF Transcript_22769/g.44728 Transcript_22769/m.44728 type:complete len:626 (-) Transcript_22769:195-2072(-)|eukprot:CAMPEP_0171498160 /NCGR_PEP_ID=MMETSP0958-20121227/7691_1 /TAXON_ID=87120 /ORGANISM="Aurantiochytrium limacinum, Strain ATCCMYA-1381" /LENGTH=625 /DNA_ID=CAMNT_0012032519 /DNA_START=761 /DNA_END=2638 /DNA_ORIENTATION=-